MADVAYAEDTYEQGGFSVRDLMEWAQSQRNIADVLDEDALSRLGVLVCREYRIDLGSCSEKRDQWDKAMRSVLQVIEEKNSPWPGASNVKYPLMTSAVMQFAARAYPAIVNNSEVVKGRVIGKDEGVQANANGMPVFRLPDGSMAPMNPQELQHAQANQIPVQPVWQLEPGAKRQQADRIAEHMSYQLTEEMEDWEEQTDKLLHMLAAYGTAFRKVYFSPELRRNATEIISPIDLVVNHKAKSLERAPRVTHVFTLYAREIEERVRKGTFLDNDYGQPADASDGDDDAPHTFLEQHRWYDLDDDGMPEPYICVVHLDTEKVARIVARFDPEGVQGRQDGTVVGFEPVQYFTKYSFVPSPDGSFYDLGFADLLWPINESVNTTINQLLDAGANSNAGGGFISDEVKVKGGVIRRKLGEWLRARLTGDDLRKSIVPFPIAEPSPTLFQLLGMLVEASQDISAVKDVLTGDTRGANQSPTTTLALIEQGLKVFTAIYKRVFRSMKCELRQLYRLNRIYLEDEVYFTVLDDVRAVRRQDYADDTLDVVPVSDPSMVTDMQRLAKAEMLLQLAQSDPMLDRRKAYERVFDAASIEDAEDLFVEQLPPDPRLALEADKIDIEKRGQQLKERELMLKERESAIEASRADIEAAETLSKILLNIAQAEAAEAGPQLDQYKAETERMVKSARGSGGTSGT